MKTILKIGSLGDVFTSTFTNFRKQCFNPDVEILELKRNYYDVQDMFVRSRQVDEFCTRITELSGTLAASGQTRIGDFLITQLCKLCQRFNMNDRAEVLLHTALENSRRKNDGMHELARLIDLEQLYKEENSRKDLFRILKEKKDCCKRVLANYDEQCKNFDTIVAPPTSKDAVKVQLAYTYSDLAYMLERCKPMDAINLYKKTSDIYSSMGHEKEVRVLQKKIRNVKVRNNLN